MRGSIYLAAIFMLVLAIPAKTVSKEFLSYLHFLEVKTIKFDL